jgi:hypothetical protein
MNNTYTTIVDTAKLAARDILRMRKLSKWMTRKTKEEAYFAEVSAGYEKTIASITKRGNIAEFEAINLPDAHPDKDARVEKAMKIQESCAKEVETVKEDLKGATIAHEKVMEDIEKATQEWIDGTRKVDAEELSRLTDELIKANVAAQFTATNTSVTQ